MRRSLPLLCLLLLPLASPSARGAETEPKGRKRLAGLVVRSKDYVVRRSPRYEEEFIGEVSYRQRGREVYSDWALREHEGERWKARGNVRLLWRFPDGSVAEARGHESRHDGVAEAGWLRPKEGELLAFERRKPDVPETDKGTARELSWDSAAETVRLSGGVHVWGPEGASWAEEALYRNAERASFLTGRRPVTYAIAPDWEGAVQADRISAYDSPRRLTAEGKVRGWLVFEDQAAMLKKL